MSVQVCCDLCGRPLGEPRSLGVAVVRLDLLVSWHADGRIKPDPWERHLCAGDQNDADSCLLRALGLFDTALQASSELAALPETGGERS